jgi:hypothetical protein
VKLVRELSPVTLLAWHVAPGDPGAPRYMAEAEGPEELKRGLPLSLPL